MKELVGPRTLAMRPAPGIQGTAPAAEQAIGLTIERKHLAWYRGRGTPETPEPLAAEAQLPHRDLDTDDQVMDNVPSNE